MVTVEFSGEGEMGMESLIVSLKNNPSVALDSDEIQALREYAEASDSDTLERFVAEL